MAEDKNPLTEVDPIFTEGHASHEEHKTEEDPLKGFDPIFNEPSNAHSSELTNEEAAKLANAQAQDHIGEVIGGVTGAIVGSGVPKYVPPQTATAQKNVAGQRAAYQAAQEMLGHQQGQRAQTVADIINQHQAAQAGLNTTRQELEAAHQAARELNALPEPIVVEPVVEPEAPKLSAGAERHANKMSEVRHANKVQRGLEGVKEFSGTGGNLSGYTRNSRLIVPQELKNAPVHTPEQLEALKRFEKAEAAHQQSIREAAKAEALKAKHTAPTATKPNELRQAETAAERTRVGLSKAEAELAELNKAKSFLSKIPYFNTIMGGLSGAELMHAYDALFNRGETLEGVMAGLGGIGGLISLVPHPAAKVVGTAMTIPPLMYEGYKALK